jgi:hypothetical protein
MREHGAVSLLSAPTPRQFDLFASIDGKRTQTGQIEVVTGASQARFFNLLLSPLYNLRFSLYSPPSWQYFWDLLCPGVSSWYALLA